MVVAVAVAEAVAVAVAVTTHFSVEAVLLLAIYSCLT